MQCWPPPAEPLALHLAPALGGHMPFTHTRRRRTLGLLTVFLSAVTPGCMDPDRPMGPADQVVAARASAADRYVVLLKEGREGVARARTLEADATRLGGRTERAHPEIGVMLVSGLSADAAAQVARREDVEAVFRDRRIQWLPPRAGQLHRGDGPSAGSNQRGAAFFRQYQW